MLVCFAFPDEALTEAAGGTARGRTLAFTSKKSPRSPVFPPQLNILNSHQDAFCHSCVSEYTVAGATKVRSLASVCAVAQCPVLIRTVLSIGR